MIVDLRYVRLVLKTKQKKKHRRSFFYILHVSDLRLIWFALIIVNILDDQHLTPSENNESFISDENIIIDILLLFF
jgi:hypothetical protein